MFGKQAVPMFIATCVLGMLGALPARAADLTLSAAAPRALATAPLKAAPAKRAEKPRHRGITTYRLFDDPAFQLRGAAPEKRHFALTDRFTSPSFLGTATGDLTAAGSAMPGRAFNAGRGEYDDVMGLTCWTQVPTRPQHVRSLTACYQQQVDKGWKAQTYVSRESAGGRADWGGGVALSFVD